MANNAIIKPYMNSEEFIRKDGSIDFIDDQSMDDNKLTNLENGNQLTDAVNLGQLNGKADLNHTIVSHDTTAIGSELDTLTNGASSNADSLHNHDQYVLINDLPIYFDDNMSGRQEFPYFVKYQYGRSDLFLADSPNHNRMYLPFSKYFNHDCRQVIPMVINENCSTPGLDETEIFVGVDCVSRFGVTLSWNRCSGAPDPEFLIYLQYFAIGY